MILSKFRKTPRWHLKKFTIGLVILGCFFYSSSTGAFEVLQLPSQPLDIYREFPEDFGKLDTVWERWALILKIAEQKDPDSCRNFWAAVAYFYESASNYSMCVDAMRQALNCPMEDDQAKVAVYANLARAYMLNDQWEAGKHWLDKADTIKYKDPHNRWLMFDYYVVHEKNYEKAAEQLAPMEDLYKPPNDLYFFALSKLRAHNVPSEAAIRLFRRAVQLSPDNVRALRVLAIAIREGALKQMDHKEDSVVLHQGMEESLEILKKAYSLAPDFVDTSLSLANTYFSQWLYFGQADEDRGNALLWYERALEMEPENPRVVFSRGIFHLNLGEYAKAIEYFEKSLELDPSKKDALKSLAQAYSLQAYDLCLGQGQCEEALSLSEKALRLEKRDGFVYSLRAEILFHLERYEEAYVAASMAEGFRYPGRDIKDLKDKIEERLQSRAKEAKDLN